MDTLKFIQLEKAYSACIVHDISETQVTVMNYTQKFRSLNYIRADLQSSI